MSTIEQAVARFAERELVLVGDERDDATFLACPADGVDASRLERLHELGRGMVVLGLSEPAASRLALPAPWRGAEPRRDIALTAPIDARIGLEGGWSLKDRARTMRVAADPGSRSSDLTIPGHVFPALIEERRHSLGAAALEMAHLSGRAPAVALSAVMDRHGRAASLRDARADDQLGRLPLASATELHSGWVARHASELSVSCNLPTQAGTFRAFGYAPGAQDPPTVALVHGEPAPSEPTLVHVHVACLFGDAFGSLLCDCRRVLDNAASAIVRAGAGVIIYAKPRQPTPVACVRDEPIDAATVAGLLRAVGVRDIRMLDGGRDTRLGDELRGCGLEVAR
jgi:3,4-dihydroxy 2-butanone 4-phosphate synthase/GTP cyclohydrolase II